MDTQSINKLIKIYSDYLQGGNKTINDLINLLKSKDEHLQIFCERSLFIMDSFKTLSTINDSNNK